MTRLVTPKTRPVFGIMGEFSAGKSTLCNLLLGENTLPQKVTATQLPPVWITYGEPEITRVLKDGTKEVFGTGELTDLPVDNTWYFRVSMMAKSLLEYDIIDFPGISDPNLASEMWEDLIPDLDSIIWCTHATQSWRQSEAAMWETIPEHIQARSLLLITRFDKLTKFTDKQRVLARVTKEAGPYFRAIHPVSLLQARNAETGSNDWTDSGVEGFIAALGELSALAPVAPETRAAEIPALASYGTEETAETNTDTAETAIVAIAPENEPEAVSAPTPETDVESKQPRLVIVPRRLTPGGGARRSARPNARSEGERESFLRSVLSPVD